MSKLKEQIKGEIRRKAEIKVIEKNNADFLIKLIDMLDSDEEIQKISQLSVLLRRTGFVYQPCFENDHTDEIHYLKKNEGLSFDQGGTKNKLIIGDNYNALQNLLIMSGGKPFVDVIYIDPPYAMDGNSEYAETNYTNQITRDHLLSMMQPRLELANCLLKKNGFISCSIDDKNQAYLKCLFDDIFGEDNFVACCPRKTVDIVRKTSSSELQKLHDYILIYRKSDTVFKPFITGQYSFDYSDAKGKYRIKAFQNSGENGTRRMRPNLYYPIYKNSDNTLSLEKNEKTIETILPAKVNGGSEDGRWLWSKEKFLTDWERLGFDKNGKIGVKEYEFECVDKNKYQQQKTWIADEKNANGSRELTSIFGKSGVFGYPKPSSLIKWICSLHPDKNAVVLDFFAGSGTTGQAVLELNEEDGGNRKYILCTNNEITDSNPNGIALDVTSKRMKRVMTGKCYDGTNDFEWAKKNKPLGGSLDVYDIEKISVLGKKGESPFEAINEQDYDLPKMDVQKKIEWVCENFEITLDENKEIE